MDFLSFLPDRTVSALQCGLFDAIIVKICAFLEAVMKTLLHICCAPCANQCVEVLRTDGVELAGFWYNPNIHPFTEYRARRNCLREYAASIALPLVERDDYALRPFVRAVAGDIARRCIKCYEMRLFETARQAKELGFDSFTSSLFISPYQNHELMRQTAERAAAEYGVSFLYRDFRPYFKAGQEKARELGFYMQKYCGCVFSEEERYLKAKKIIP
jgi:predicted adenine nucleotide alpha hydrolase (AANH) superfamily ATPase